jgi:hypothetical protein
MSLIIAVYIPTGIVLSGDSRTTGTRRENLPDPQNPGQLIQSLTQIVLSDSAYKVFSIASRYGIGIFGDAIINDMPIAYHMEQFQLSIVSAAPANTQTLCDRLNEYFRALGQFNIGFIVIGYDNHVPSVFSKDIQANTFNRVNVQNGTTNIAYGIRCGGETDVVQRLFSQPLLVPPFQVMSLQDAVDFSRHLIRATIDQMRFEPRFATVGGAIDSLIITPNSISFLQRKGLVCS